MIATLLSLAPFISAIAAVGAVVMSIRNSFKIKEVHILLNSRLDQLLRATRESSEAKGASDERNRNPN